MAWDEPPITGVNLQAYFHQRQYYRSLQEKSCATGFSMRWPGFHTVFDSGTISGFADNGDGSHTLTDSDKDWDVAGLPPGCTGDSLWTGVTCEHDPNRPAFYDVVIEGGGVTDETMVVRAEIQDNTTTDLIVSDMRDYVAGKVIPSLGSLVGKSYFIIRRGGLFWSDRWPAWPNGFPTQAQIASGDRGKQELWYGTVTAGAVGALTDAYDRLRNLHEPTYSATQLNAWHTDRWKDYELLYYGADDRLYRVKISGNNNNTLTIPDGAVPKVGSNYSIVEVGCRCIPGRTVPAANLWYSGYQQPYWSHFPDDGPFHGAGGGVDMPEFYAKWVDGNDPDFCDDVETDHDAYDVDPHIPTDNVCDGRGGDYFFAPDAFKSRRYLQVTAEGNAPLFVDTTINPEGFASELSPPAIPLWTVATLFQAALLESNQRTITSVDDGTHTATIPSLVLPKRTTGAAATTSMTVFFAVKNTVGDILTSGTGTLTSTTLQHDSLVNADHAGKQLVIAFGWTRYYPREVHRLYPQTVFIPDVDSSDGGAGAIDPASVVGFAESGCFGVGAYVHRDADTTYVERDGLGFAGPGSETFINGEFVRYVGSNADMPDIGYESGGDFTLKQDGPGAPDDLQYWDHFYIGQHLPAPQAVILGQMSGNATGGGTDYLVDDSQEWYSTWYSAGAGPMRQQTGTASSGSTSTIVFTKPTGADLCWWQSGVRDVHGTPYQDFPVKISQTRGSVTTEYRSVISSTSVGSTTITITFRAVTGMPAVQSGDTFTIDEPYEVNRWQGRALRYTKPDGSAQTVTIRWSDDTHIYFDVDKGEPPVAVGDPYEIIEVLTGAVLKRAGNLWIDTAHAGVTDSRGGRFVDPSTGNLPTICRWFGRLLPGDYIGRQFTELYFVLNKLRWTRKDVTWSSRADPDVCELNAGGTGDSGVDCSDTYDYHSGRASGAWGCPCFIYDENCEAVDFNLDCYCEDPPDCFTPKPCFDLTAGATLPHAMAQGGVDGIGDPCGALLNRSYAYANVIGLPVCLAKTVEIWCYADLVRPNGCIVEFDDNGDGLIENAWALVQNVTVIADTGDTKKVKVGSLDDAPTIAAEPPVPCDDPDKSSITFRGYEIQYGAAIVKWDVTGGFTFIN